MFYFLYQHIAHPPLFPGKKNDLFLDPVRATTLGVFVNKPEQEKGGELC
jgi:hypothetical protein